MIPVLLSQLLIRHAIEVGRAVDKHIEPPEPRLNATDQPFDVGRAREIGLEGQGVSRSSLPKCLNRLLGLPG